MHSTCFDQRLQEVFLTDLHTLLVQCQLLKKTSTNLLPFIISTCLKGFRVWYIRKHDLWPVVMHRTISSSSRMNQGYRATFTILDVKNHCFFFFCLFALITNVFMCLVSIKFIWISMKSFKLDVIIDRLNHGKSPHLLTYFLLNIGCFSGIFFEIKV